MKNDRKVILIILSLSSILVFAAIAWFMLNGKLVAKDRSGMKLSIGETARHFFSVHPDNGVMFLEVEFPKQPDTSSISQSKAHQHVRRLSLKRETIFWTHIDGLGKFGVFAERALGEVSIYRENEGFVSVVLLGQGERFEIHEFSDPIPFPRQRITLIPEGLQVSKWEFKRNDVFGNLDRFTRSSWLDPSTSVEEIGIYCGRVNQGSKGEDEDYLIYFDGPIQAWKVKKWPPKRLLSEWKAFLAEEAKN